MKQTLGRHYSKIKSSKHVQRFWSFSQHPLAVPVFVIMALTLLSALGYVWFFKKEGQPIVPNSAFIVIVSHDDEVQTVPSHKQTVGDLLAKMDIEINPGDVVEPSPETPIEQDDFRVNVYRAVPVKVVQGNQAKYAFSAATTSRSIAEQVGYHLKPFDDVITQPVDNFLKEGAIGERIVIDRATPINLNLYGTPLQTGTHAKTVGDMLREKGIKLGSSDQVLPAPDTPIVPNQQIFVASKGSAIQLITEPIAMPVKTVDDAGLSYGTRAIRQQGSAGQRIVTYQIDKATGLRKIIQTVVITPPITQIVAIGTNLSGTRGDVARAGIAASDYTYVDYIISRESGWCPTKWQGQYGSCPAYHGTPTSSYTGYGLCQATPGYKMASAGADWATNPITQLKWCDGYATGRYGSWYAAYRHWITHHSW